MSSPVVLNPAFLRRTLLATAIGLGAMVAAHAADEPPAPQASADGASDAATPKEPSMFDGWSVFLGLAYIDVNARASDLTNTSLPAGLRVGDATTVGFGFAYRFMPKWSVEAVLGLPPEHSVYGTKNIDSYGQITLVKQAPPSVFLNYHFDPVFDKFSPFVGAGLNYTWFMKTRSTQSGNAASGGDTKIKLKPSFGLTAHVGGTYQLSEHWSIVGTVAYADVRSKMTATTKSNEGDGIENVQRKSNINFRPVVYTLSVGYSF